MKTGFNALKSDACVYIFNEATTEKEALTADDDYTVILYLCG